MSRLQRAAEKSCNLLCKPWPSLVIKARSRERTFVAARRPLMGTVRAPPDGGKQHELTCMTQLHKQLDQLLGCRASTRTLCRSAAKTRALPTRWSRRCTLQFRRSLAVYSWATARGGVRVQLRGPRATSRLLSRHLPVTPGDAAEAEEYMEKLQQSPRDYDSIVWALHAKLFCAPRTLSHSCRARRQSNCRPITR